MLSVELIITHAQLYLICILIKIVRYYLISSLLLLYGMNIQIIPLVFLIQFNMIIFILIAGIIYVRHFKKKLIE